MIVSTENPFRSSGIPADLKSIPRWICWRWTPDANGKLTKVPKQPRNPNWNASSVDASHWTDFQTAVTAARANDIGIGFVLAGDGLCGLDLDDCRDPDSGRLLGWAEDFIQFAGSYCEVSPSQTGVKIFMRGSLPDTFRKKHVRPDGDGALEIFQTARFFTVTGHKLDGAPSTIRDSSEKLNTILKIATGWNPEPVRPVREPAIASSGDDRIKRAAAYLDRIPGAVSGQGGHNHTFNTALKLASFGLNRDEMFDLLSRWNQRCEPLWSEHELWHKIDSALKSNPERIPDRPFERAVDSGVDISGLLGEAPTQRIDPIPESRAIQCSPKPLIIRSAGQLIQEFPELRSPVINGLLRRGETMNVIAAPKTGKSWLALGLGLSVVAGRKWLNQFWTTSGNVLMIDNELHPETSADRLPKIATKMGIELDTYKDRLFIANLRGGLLNMNELGVQLRGLKSHSFSLVILDAWYRFQPPGSDENSNCDVAALYNLIDLIASEIGAAFVCIHHTSKGNQAGKGVTDVGAGAGAQARAPDSHLAMRQHETPNAVVVEAAVRSFPPMEPFCLRWKFPAWEPADELDPADLKQDRPKKAAKVSAENEVDAEEKRQLSEIERRERVIAAYQSCPEGETLSKIRVAAGLNNNYFDPIQAELIRDGVVVSCTVKKQGRTYQGFRLIPDSDLEHSNNSNETQHVRVVRDRFDHADNDLEQASPPFRGEAVRSRSSARPSDVRPKPSNSRVLMDDEIDRVDDLFPTQSA